MPDLYRFLRREDNRILHIVMMPHFIQEIRHSHHIIFERADGSL